MKFIIINGPNLDQLGQRQNSLYGHQTLADLKGQIDTHLRGTAYDYAFHQSNHEGEIVDILHTYIGKPQHYIIINAAAYTHSSLAIRDAILCTSLPFIEVHISNIYAREPFRHKSFLSDIAQGVICGLGFQGYIAAIDYFIQSADDPRKKP